MPEGVVIVDDDAQFRAAARRILEADGFAVVGEAADAAQALKAITALTPSVVLVDVQLPDRDGFELAGLLAVQSPPVIVVLVSSRPAAAYGRRLGASSARGFIAKENLSGPALREVMGW